MNLCPRPNEVRFFKESNYFSLGPCEGFPVTYTGKESNNFNNLLIEKERMCIKNKSGTSCISYKEIERLGVHSVGEAYSMIMHKKNGEKITLIFSNDNIQEFQMLWAFLVS